MDTHKNAPLAPKGREAMVRGVIDGGLSKAAAARTEMHAHVRPTLRRWRSQTKLNVNLCVDPRVGQVQDVQNFRAPASGFFS